MPKTTQFSQNAEKFIFADYAGRLFQGGYFRDCFFDSGLRYFVKESKRFSGHAFDFLFIFPAERRQNKIGRFYEFRQRAYAEFHPGEFVAVKTGYYGTYAVMPSGRAGHPDPVFSKRNRKVVVKNKYFFGFDFIIPCRRGD